MNGAMNQENYYGNPRREMMAFVPEHARKILDVGCGAGVFGAGLKASRELQNSPEIWGVEMDVPAAEAATDVLDWVVQGDVLKVLPTLAGEVFDTVVMNDVLEHLAEPADLLGAIRPLLAADGVLVASIPNVRYFFNVMDLAWNGRWEYTDEGILDRTHLRFFTRSSISLLLRENGFQVEKMVGINATGSLKFKLANFVSLGRFSDMRFLQYAVTARLAR
jgi:2-polyprenyl-3-methyl-5-hydroxy-6-metoxy-1,4-benzoquinol methylase